MASCFCCYSFFVYLFISFGQYQYEADDTETSELWVFIDKIYCSSCVVWLGLFESFAEASVYVEYSGETERNLYFLGVAKNT